MYSKQLDGGFCKVCAIFARNRENLGVLVNKSFTNWVKVNNVCEGHATNGYHIRAVEAGLYFQRSVEQSRLNIDVRMNTQLFNHIQENRPPYHPLLCRVYSLLWTTVYCPQGGH